MAEPEFIPTINIVEQGDLYLLVDQPVKAKLLVSGGIICKHSTELGSRFKAIIEKDEEEIDDHLEFTILIESATAAFPDLLSLLHNRAPKGIEQHRAQYTATEVIGNYSEHLLQLAVGAARFGCMPKVQPCLMKHFDKLAKVVKVPEVVLIELVATAFHVNDAYLFFDTTKRLLTECNKLDRRDDRVHAALCALPTGFNRAITAELDSIKSFIVREVPRLIPNYEADPEAAEDIVCDAFALPRWNGKGLPSAIDVIATAMGMVGQGIEEGDEAVVQDEDIEDFMVKLNAHIAGFCLECLKSYRSPICEGMRAATEDRAGELRCSFLGS